MSSIFFSKISVVDHARLTSLGPVGGSVNLSAIASLPHDMMDEEQVVVDFSSGKKQLKNIIDAHDNDQSINGFDHKLWVPNDVDVKFTDTKTTRDWVTVEDDFVVVSGPADMFKFMDLPRARMNSLDAQAYEMEKLIKSQTRIVEYGVRLDEDAYPDSINRLSYDSATRMFGYMHGLPKSSSYGCKNILHGHKSFVRVNCSDHSVADYVADTISTYLDDTYLVCKDHVVDDFSVRYVTSRGEMSLKFKTLATRNMNFLVLDSEPTIENIIDYAIAKVDIPRQPMTIMISEGLQKGALVRIQ